MKNDALNPNEGDAAKDAAWQALLARSSATFTGEPVPPYGFVTAMNARLHAEQGQVELIERIGLRALWASASVLALAVAGTLVVNLVNKGNDFEPGVRSIVQVENVSIS